MVHAFIGTSRFRHAAAVRRRAREQIGLGVLGDRVPCSRLSEVDYSIIRILGSGFVDQQVHLSAFERRSAAQAPEDETPATGRRASLQIGSRTEFSPLSTVSLILKKAWASRDEQFDVLARCLSLVLLSVAARSSDAGSILDCPRSYGRAGDWCAKASRSVGSWGRLIGAEIVERFVRMLDERAPVRPATVSMFGALALFFAIDSTRATSRSSAGAGRG